MSSTSNEKILRFAAGVGIGGLLAAESWVLAGLVLIALAIDLYLYIRAASRSHGEKTYRVVLRDCEKTLSVRARSRKEDFAESLFERPWIVTDVVEIDDQY